MDKYWITILLLSFGISTSAQTVIVDYSEYSKANTASIHVIESTLPIANSNFDDISKAKTKLVKTLEDYRIDGYKVKTSNVSTHKQGRGFHYHFQYVLQREGERQVESSLQNNNQRKMLSPEKRMQMREEIREKMRNDANEKPVDVEKRSSDRPRPLKMTQPAEKMEPAVKKAE